MSHDLTDLGPTMQCLCGGTEFKLLVTWDLESREVASYDMWMYCNACDARCYAPTPIDEVAL